MYEDIKAKLKNGDCKIGIWGLGYIGYSSMAYFAKNGVSCIGYDVNKRRVINVNTEGKCDIYHMEYWLGFDTCQLIATKLMYATMDKTELMQDNVPVQLICIPTELDGKPYDEYLLDVIGTLVKHYEKKRPKLPPIFLIESTLTPNRLDKVVIPFIEKKGMKVGKDVLLGVAPRRDWFVSPDKTLETLPRIVGATDQKTTNIIADVLSIISKNILKASDHNHACIVKSIENAFRQLEITFANQLSLAYPHLNMVEILKLAGTKWNVGTYHPSFGTGGYCIPLAPQYVLEGAKRPEALTLLKESLKTDFSQPERVAESLKKRGVKKVGILGLAYTHDIKVATLSPTIAIVRELQKRGVDVKVNDPLFHDDEIKDITGAPTFDFPEGMAEFDTILMVSGHLQYLSLHHQKVVSNLKSASLIIDNMGFWNDINFGEIEYHEAGDAGWLEKA